MKTRNKVRSEKKEPEQSIRKIPVAALKSSQIRGPNDQKKSAYLEGFEVLRKRRKADEEM